METCSNFLSDTSFAYQICWTSAGTSESGSLFGISDYLSALALLMVVYTISDFKVKLRLSVSPFPIYKIGFWLFVIVLLLKALLEIWFYYGWPIPVSLDNKAPFDVALLGPCILAILFWIHASYISPPVFSKWNAEKFFWTYHQAIHNGSQDDLRIALDELFNSASSIVKYALMAVEDGTNKRPASDVASFAHDFLLLMGNPRMCAEMVGASPKTAVVFFRELIDQKGFDLPVGPFVQNVATNFITNKSSPIYHEDSGWQSGWSGYARPYSAEIFGSFELNSALARRHASPLDVRYMDLLAWDAENWEAYTRVSLLYLKQVIKRGSVGLQDYSVNQILENCKAMSQGAYRLNGVDGAYYEMDEYRKILVQSKFIGDVLKLLDKSGIEVRAAIKPKENYDDRFHARLAKLIADVIFDVASVREPAWTCWQVTHNAIWSELSRPERGKTSRWVFKRVCRLMYSNIRDMDSWFNFKGAGYLGFCLNVLGLSEKRRKDYRDLENPLRLSVLKWIRANYSRMMLESPKVAKSILHGSVTFDEATFELVKSFSNETGKAPSEQRFKVDRP